MVAGDAWLGDTPAAWMTPVTSPRAVAAWTSACTDSRDDTSTVAVLTSNPASLITSAAASAFAWRRSASRTCLPALARRAIAWPIEPGPMTTTTSLRRVSFMVVSLRCVRVAGACCGGWWASVRGCSSSAARVMCGPGVRDCLGWSVNTAPGQRRKTLPIQVMTDPPSALVWAAFGAVDNRNEIRDFLASRRPRSRPSSGACR